jgi:phosphate transport system permease protein
MASILASQFTEADTELYLDALVEIGLVLFIITLIINALSRLLIWSMARSRTKAPAAAVAAEAAA